MLTRFAPSPTGFLHLGHAFSARSVWNWAGARGAPVRLRLEDIDQTRCRPAYAAAIEEDLTWLGFQWQGATRRQSDHFPDYQRALDSLIDRSLVYRCFRTRRQLPDGEAAFVGEALAPPDEAERLDRGAAFNWRLSLAAAKARLGAAYSRLGFTEETGGGARWVSAEPDRLGDVILARKDAATSYHLACCHDDALQGVTHVIRGEDLREVTHIHVLLQTLMDWPQPVYRFHPLLLGASGAKLSKSTRDKALRDYRMDGATPDEIWRQIGAE
jgi:glutamyl-Q tRNA(Asp) synthetase